MKTKKIIMKSMLRKAMVLTVFSSLSIFMASANFSTPDEDMKSSSEEVSAVSTGEKTVLEQTQAERKPFGEDDAPQSQLRAAPGGGGTGQKEEVPVGEGIWIVIGLAIVYGVACRKSQKDIL